MSTKRICEHSGCFSWDTRQYLVTAPEQSHAIYTWRCADHAKSDGYLNPPEMGISRWEREIERRLAALEQAQRDNEAGK